MLTSDGFCEAHCTLREAITAANESPSSTIEFSAIAFGAHKVIDLGAPLPTITASVEILGPPQGVTIRRTSGGNYRIFFIPALDTPVKLYGLTISNGNSNGDGGGIYSKSYLELKDVTVDGNRSGDHGGGVALWAAGLIEDSTFSNNSAASGGGLYFEPAPTDSVLLINSTVSGNTSPFSTAILLANFTHINNVTLNVSSCTIAYNTGSSYGILAYALGASRQASVNLTSTILGDNGVQNLGQAFGNGGCVYLNSGGYNLATDAPGALTSTGDQVNTNPLLAPLALYGGRTPVHALRSGSPALDTGNCALSGVTLDQRGKRRPFDRPGSANAADACDIGAFEWSDLDGDGAEDSDEIFRNGFEQGTP